MPSNDFFVLCLIIGALTLVVFGLVLQGRRLYLRYTRKRRHRALRTYAEELEGEMLVDERYPDGAVARFRVVGVKADLFHTAKYVSVDSGSYEERLRATSHLVVRVDTLESHGIDAFDFITAARPFARTPGPEGQNDNEILALLQHPDVAELLPKLQNDNFLKGLTWQIRQPQDLQARRRSASAADRVRDSVYRVVADRYSDTVAIVPRLVSPRARHLIAAMIT